MQEKKLSIDEFLSLLSERDKKSVREQITELQEISKYSKILFFQSKDLQSRLSILSPEIINKIASYTGPSGILDSERAERVACNGFEWG